MHGAVCSPDGRRFDVTIKNISSGGMRAISATLPAKGSFVEAILPNVGGVRARVSWTGEGEFGLAFLQAVDPAAVRRPMPPGRPYVPVARTTQRRFC